MARTPANWPPDRAEHWDLRLRARAVENLAYVAGINRTGTGGGLRFDGRSQVIDPTGKVLVRRVGTDVEAVEPVVPEKQSNVAVDLTRVSVEVGWGSVHDELGDEDLARTAPAPLVAEVRQVAPVARDRGEPERENPRHEHTPRV